jgi:CRISPR-associated protein Cmr2
VAEDAVRAQLRSYGNTARQLLARVRQAPPDAVWDMICQRQLDAHLEIFWAAAPFLDEYQQAYEQMDRALAACKRSRTFIQVREDGRKDSLSGQRSALHIQEMDANRYWEAVARSGVLTGAQLKPDGHERLDALGAIKRFAFSRPVPSTSSVAATDFLQRAATHALKQLQRYRQLLAGLSKHFYQVTGSEPWPYDGDLLFLETLQPGRLEASYSIKPGAMPDQQLEEARAALRQLHEAAGGPPNPYYAVLQMDGDSIGKMVSKCQSRDEHRQLSNDFASFAQCAEKIIEKAQGVPIYCGGDDVLALLPLQAALATAEQLAAAFSAQVHVPAALQKERPRAYASAGITVAHHLAPLDGILGAVRAAEQQAKRITDKNAVCVTVLKRSGEPVSARSHWLGTAPDASGRNAWELLCDALSGDSPLISPRFAHEYARLAPMLPEKAQIQQLRRLLWRHGPARPTAAQKQQIARLEDALQLWVRQLNNTFDRENGEVLGATELSRWLLIAAFLTRGGGE